MDECAARALVVEDEGAWQEILTEILQDMGLVVDCAGSFGTAISLLRSEQHRVAVVDLALAGSDHHNHDGLAVLDALRRLDPGCSAIMLTGFATVEVAVSALSDYGALTCLRKEGFSRDEFRDWVARALAVPPPQLAVAAEDAQVVESRAEGPGAPPMRAALVAEDDAAWRSILGELLSDAGYEPDLCASYGEAQGRLLRNDYALAVIDLSLADSEPAMLADDEIGESDGFRLLRNAGGAGVPTVVVSGVAAPAGIDRTYSELGVYAFLEKQTFAREGFLRAVREAGQTGSSVRDYGALTQREREVAALLTLGMTNKEIGEELVITINTVKRHLKAVFAKLAVRTRSAAAAKAISMGLRPLGREQRAARADREV